MQTTDQELTKHIEKHRIFGIFTAVGVLAAVKEISKTECEKFFQWSTGQDFSKLDFDDIWSAYIQHTSISKNPNQVVSTNR